MSINYDMITERMFEKGEDKSMEEYYVERAGRYMRYQVFPGEGTPILFIKDRVRALILAEANLDLSKEGATSYEITRVSEKDFMKTSYQLLLETCKKSGNTMWAATLTNWEPYAAYRFSESALRGGNPSWRQCLYRLPIKKSFIYGEKSLPDKDWEELESRGIHLEIVAGAGHSMAWENPDGLAMAIADCIKGMQ